MPVATCTCRACSNDPSRLRGQAQSEILCMQREGWLVVPILQTDWSRAVEACGQSGDGYECMADFVDEVTAEAAAEMGLEGAAPELN